MFRLKIYNIAAVLGLITYAGIVFIPRVHKQIDIDQLATSIDVSTPEQFPPSFRQIIIENNITKKMLGYKMFGIHYPDEFRIIIDDIELFPNDTREVTIQNSILLVRYEYRWGNRRNGAKIVTFELNPEQDYFIITFKWKDDWRILINDAIPLEIQEIT